MLQSIHWLALWSAAILCFVFWLRWVLKLKFYNRSDIRLITVSGPSGAGKTTIIGELLKRHPDWSLVISLTSREPREGRDLPGEYICNLSARHLRRLDEDGKALWREEEHGNVYVTLFVDVNTARRSNTISFMPILPRSVVKLRSYVPSEELLSIFILPPGEEEQKRRFEKRGDTTEQIERRIADCKKWEEEARSSGIPYVFIKNDGTIAEAVEKVEKMIEQYVHPF